MNPGKLLARATSSLSCVRSSRNSSLLEELNAALQLEESREIDLAKVDEADQPHVLARHIGTALEKRRLAAIKDPSNRLSAADELRAIEELSDSFIAPIQQLHSLRPSPGPGHTTRFVHRPKTPLNDAALLTNAHGEPSLASELRAEIDSADSVDLLCAFVMWHGVRLIEGELAARSRAGSRSGS